MEVQSYYASQSVFTDPGANADLLAALPGTVPELVETVQGLMLMHDEIYKYPIQNERVRDTLCRYAEDILTRLVRIDKKSPLTEFRGEDQRFIADSSDFAVLLIAALRQRGIPARKRTGFVPFVGFYNDEEYYRLHDVVEYWDGKAWVRVDPTGISEGKEFICAAKAWQDCRVGLAAPDKFRDEERRDFDILTAALLLDLAGLGKQELTVWDRFGWACMPFGEFTSKQWQTLDDLAIIIRKGDAGQEELVEIYKREEGLQVPSTVWCASVVVPPHKVELKK